jgi:hypothetical protein
VVCRRCWYPKYQRLSPLPEFKRTAVENTDKIPASYCLKPENLSISMVAAKYNNMNTDNIHILASAHKLTDMEIRIFYHKEKSNY